MTEARNGTVDLALLDPILEHYAGQRGALIPVLQKAQEAYGYLPREVLQAIAKRLGLSLSKVYGVATFYAQFYLEKRGRHVLKLCDGTACHVKGAPALINAVKEEFGIDPGATSEDGELTEEIVYCLGSCALAPAAVIDGQVAGRLRPDTLIPRLKKSLIRPSEAEEGGDGNS